MVKFIGWGHKYFRAFDRLSRCHVRVKRIMVIEAVQSNVLTHEERLYRSAIETLVKNLFEFRLHTAPIELMTCG